MSQGVPRAIRAIVGVVALVALLMVINGWYRDYRGETARPDASVEETTTPGDAEEAAEGDGGDDEAGDGEQDGDAASSATVVVIIEGLNFRREPSQGGEMIRGLSRNDRLAHLGTADGWYHVRDSEGVEGYVSANPQYTELEE